MQIFQYSAVGMSLTKEFEGLRLKAYLDCAGIWTVGYGHTGDDVHDGRWVTEPEATELLAGDLHDAVGCVNRAIAHDITLEQHQFDALVDFCFNVGRGNFQQSSLLTYVNRNNFTSAAHQFNLWINVDRKPVPGLIRRRAAEAALFRNERRDPLSR